MNIFIKIKMKMKFRKFIELPFFPSDLEDIDFEL